MFVRQPEPTAAQLRWFGASLALALTCLAAILWFRFEPPMISGVAMAVAIALLLIYYLIPASRKTVYQCVTSVTYRLSMMLGIVLLSIVFFTIIWPIGWALKLAGRDPLAKRPDRSAQSYWQASPKKPSLSQYFRMH
jgi:hypothetical protein